MSARSVFCIVTILAVSSVSVALAEPADVMRVHFINVGQGAATLIEYPEATILIDTGGERTPHELWRDAEYDSTEALMAYLDDFFEDRDDDRLTLLALTHPHLDHTRGVEEVLETYAPRNVIHNGQTRGSGAEQQGIARRYVRDSDAKGWYVLQASAVGTNGLSNGVIDPINPPAGGGRTDPTIRALWGQVTDRSGWDFGDFDDENNHSLVIRIDFGAASILFTGDLEEAEEDGEKAGIERLIAAHGNTGLLDADVYLVGHHGSHNGNTSQLVQKITPKIAVIAAGPPERHGSYTARKHGHPRIQALDELLSANSLIARTPANVTYFEEYQGQPQTMMLDKAIYCTGWDGTVVLEAKPNGEWKLVE